MDFPLQQYYPDYSDASFSQDQSRRSIPFAMPVSSYFRRPSKIVKSRNQSPKRLLRRRTTTAGTYGHPKLPSSDQIAQQNYPSQLSFDQGRPLSWHPSTYEQPIDFSQYQDVSFFPQFDFSNSPFNTAKINGLITPMTAPVLNEPQIQDYMSPLEDYSPSAFPTVPFAYEYPPKESTYLLPEQQYHVQEQVYVPQSVSYGNQFSIPQMYQTQPSTYSQLNIDTAPPSPSLLPIQNFDTDRSTSPFLLGSPRVEKEELVGMGLYDRPQDVHSSTLFNGATTMAALTAGIGKGLKLEESFEPPPMEDDEEEEVQEDNEEDEPNDLGTSNTVMSNNMLPQQLYAANQTNYAGQTFFFDDKEVQPGMQAATQLNYPRYQTSDWASATNLPYNWI